MHPVPVNNKKGRGVNVRPVLLSISMVMAIIMSIASLSCSMVKKTEPGKMPPPTRAYLLPTTPGEADALSSRLARVAESVPEVRRATVVLTHTTAIVGLELHSASDKGEVFKKVVALLDEEEARIQTVRITSNTETIERIKLVADAIHGGKTVNRFSREIVDIMRTTIPIRL